MVQAWYDKGVFLYLMAGICGIGVFFKVILGWYLGRMVRNTEKMQKTRKKWLQKMRQDYQICAKEYGRVNNVDIFVDKYIGNRRFLGIMLSTWDKFGGQTALICAGIAVVAAAAGVFYQVDREAVLFTFFVGIWLVIINMVVDNMASLPEKREQAATNLKDYFINRVAGPEPLMESASALRMGQEAAGGAVPELALARVTENELEALLGGQAGAKKQNMAEAEGSLEMEGQEAGSLEMEGQEAGSLEMEEQEADSLEMEGQEAGSLGMEGRKAEALRRGRALDAGMPGGAQKAQTRLYVINNEQESAKKRKTKAEKAKTKQDGLVEAKAAAAQKESRKEAAARKKREKAVRQAMARKEMEKEKDAGLAEAAEGDEALAKAREGLALASLQTAAASMPAESSIPAGSGFSAESGIPVGSGLSAESSIPAGSSISDGSRQRESMAAPGREKDNRTAAAMPVPGMPASGREEAAPEPAAGGRYPGNGQLIEDVLREFFV